MINEKINIKAIVFKLLSRWHYFFIAAVVILPIAYGYTKYATKVYHIQGSLLLKNEQQNGLGRNEFLKGMDLFNSHTDLEDEIGILKSYSLAEKTIRELDFGVSYFVKKNFTTSEKYTDAPFRVVLDSSFNQITEVPIFIEPLEGNQYWVEAKGKRVDAYNFLTGKIEDHFANITINQVAEMGKPFRSKELGFTLYYNESFKPEKKEKYYFVVHDLTDVADYYHDKLNVAPISRESNIVHLSIRGQVPHKTITFLNTLLDVYLKSELDKKNQLGLRTIRFIDNQLSGVSDSLKQVEGWLEDFRVKSNIQDINATAETLSKNLDRLETEKSNIEVKLKYYTYISNSLTEGRFDDIVAPSTFGLEDPLLSSLLIELSKLNQERAGLNYNAKEENPLSEVIELKIANTKKTLMENVKNIINVSTIAMNDLDVRINRINNELNRLPRNERELVNIQRKFDFSDNVYNYLLEKRAEAGIAIASNSVEKTIVDRAKVIGNEPVSPNNKITYLIAIFLSIVFPIALIIGEDFWNDHIHTIKDIENATTIPLIGSIIHGSREERGSLVAHHRSPLTESFQSLRVNLQYLTLGKEKNVIGVTSSIESEGKTFCAVNLAAIIAQSDKKTILIDADMRRPSVSGYFEFENTKGLSNYLVGNCSLADIIHSTKIKGFDVITAGPVPPNPLNLIGLPQMEQLINLLKKTYDTIIIDAPPIGYVAEYIILMKYTDANIYVVRSEYTSRDHLSKINKLYEDKKISNVSILLNDVKTMRAYGYKNGYGTAYQS